MASVLPSVPAIACPFAEYGSKTSIPTYYGSGGEASMREGFPEKTAMPISGGGIPPSRADMNGLGNVATFPQYYLEMGGYYTFDANVASAIGGYPNGAILTYYDSANKVVRKLRSLKADNFDNFISTPSVIGSSWEDVTPAMLNGRKLFDVFYSLSTQDNYGAVKLAGQTLTRDDYPEFCEEAGIRAASGKIPTKTIQQYQSELGSTGQCGSFVITKSGDTVTSVKLPVIKSFIQNIASGGAIGKVHQAGLPNISGSVKHAGRSSTVAMMEDGATLSGAFSPSVTGQREKADMRGSLTNYITELKFNASASNPIYGKSNTVQPDSVELQLYIQVIEQSAAMGGGGGSGSGGGMVVTSSAATSAALVLSGGTMYVFTEPLTSLTISGAEVVFSSGGVATTLEAQVSFTLASGGAITLPPTSTLRRINDPQFVAGKSYAVAVNGLGLVAGEVTE